LELPEMINGTSPVKSNERRQVSSPPFPGKVMFSKISFGSIVEGIFHPWRKAGRKDFGSGHSLLRIYSYMQMPTKLND